MNVYIVCGECKQGKLDENLSDAAPLPFAVEHAVHGVELVAEAMFLSEYLRNGYRDVDRPNAKPIVTSIGSGAAPGGDKPMPYGAPGGAKETARKQREAQRALMVGGAMNPQVIPPQIVPGVEIVEEGTVVAHVTSVKGDTINTAPGPAPRTVQMRPSWDETFLRVAGVLAQRGTCSRLKVGAVLVKDTRIISTGYNGAPAGLRHCDHRDGADMENGHCSRAEHAERNALLLSRADARGATMYVTASPCLACARMAVTVGVTRIVYGADYQPDQRVDELCAAAGIELVAFRL